MSEYMDPNLSKLSVRKDLRVTVKRIAADRNEFIYDLAEKVFKDAFPEYFRKWNEALKVSKKDYREDIYRRSKIYMCTSGYWLLLTVLKIMTKRTGIQNGRSKYQSISRYMATAEIKCML